MPRFTPVRQPAGAPPSDTPHVPSPSDPAAVPPTPVIDPTGPRAETYAGTTRTVSPRKTMKVVFKIETFEGEIPLNQEGTEAELQAALVSIGRDGLTLPNQNGFVWYPVTSIRKVVVQTL